MISRKNSGKCSSPGSSVHGNHHLLSLDFTAICSKDLFPSKVSVLVFVLYMGLFINQGILVTASRRGGDSYSYSTTTVVLLTEVVKLVASLLLYFSTSSQRSLVRDIVLHYKLFIHYLVPAALYSVYNNLSFLNLVSFDPTTYFLFLQFRVVVTGLSYQCVFRRTLSKRQWVSLIILTVGCIIKNMGVVATKEGASESFMNRLVESIASIQLLFIIVQIFCSSLAGVYCEFLLKRLSKGEEVDLHFQNICMYFDSIVCNGFLLSVHAAFSQNPVETQMVTWKSITEVGKPLVLLLILNNSAVGIVTAFFLKTFNSILKTFASALELMFTAVLCWLIFGIPIDYATVVAIFVVSYAILLYAQNPIKNEHVVTSGSSTAPLFMNEEGS
ncbi:unnamed protein product [Cyprideis torosa]|uniref:Uncharacterized protein n=1 Tax=Cyprideis torosa TaxID=163714 RepID=A0A7R8WLN6_9CRUS|nr:unnamed protein product [Cyprideis torosa]CAG0904542.1 unnamed protein product [Cyprideis torosa]